jgi:hypothetical protein
MAKIIFFRAEYQLGDRLNKQQNVIFGVVLFYLEEPKNYVTDFTNKPGSSLSLWLYLREIFFICVYKSRNAAS